MAKSKSKKTATQVANTNKVQGENTMSALSASDIQELLAGSRSKGAGTEVMKEFLDTGEAGTLVDLTSGPLAGKEPGQAYTTLTNARKRTAQAADGSTVLANPEFKNIRVIKRNHGTKDAPDFRVYLVDTTKVDVS